MIDEIPFLTQRMQYAERRVEELRSEIDKDEDLCGSGICVYITGSYGRLEAHGYSDLDLFFVKEGSAEHDEISRVDKAIFDAALIKAARRLDFPEFTKGGVYLEIHYLDDILRFLGSPDDDYKNYFTARMLLLLESIPILGVDEYNYYIERIVDSYYRDYHDHEINFLPAFLVNDIHRYWITMCLNYEHARNRKDRSDEEKNRAHLKNVKLKFSRLLTCYSMIIPILSFNEAIPPAEIIKLAQKTPIGRLLLVAESYPNLADAINAVLNHYSWFLEKTGRSESEVLEWIADQKNRDDAFEKARDFGKSIFKLVTETASDSERLRYLIV